MRLSKIKLAGFKSFVDPTTLTLPSNLVGVVGPNGCGKSNTIDAVRWVMGESSAKHLRGASMEDVIFNGSSSRKPVGQASIELVFDNSDGLMGGEFARFSEISVRRQVTRESGASYYLNGTKCRRRDVTDLFLGTGLGPRSYAIIEQGMISRLIEAKPQDLRVYLEEAAGISKYKERRRETEKRIRHTRDHLDRLSDLRDEIEKQISHLKRQADTAIKFADLKSAEERLQAEAVALRLRDLESQASVIDVQLTEASLELEKRLASLRETEANIESQREQRVEQSEQFNDVQGRFYHLGNEISRTEQSINHRNELKHRQAREKQDQQAALDQVQEHIRNDTNRLDEINSQISTLEPEIEIRAEQQALGQDQLEESEERYSQWQNQWDDFNQRSREPAQRAQVEKARMEQLERQIASIGQRMERIQSQLQQIGDTSTPDLIEELCLTVVELEEAEAAGHETLETTLQAIDEIAIGSRELRESQDLHRRGAQSKRGRLASLQALQQAALGKDRGKSEQWLKQQGLSGNHRLGETLTVDPEWDVAVETVLGSFLEAVSVNELDNLERSLESLGDQSLTFFEHDSSTGHLTVGKLADKVAGPNTVTAMLSNVLPAENLVDALRMRKELAPYQSVVTKDGLWLGPGWLRVSRGDAEKQGVLKRKEEIEALTQELEILDERIASDEEVFQQKRERLQELESQRKELQLAANHNHKAVMEAHTRLTSQKNQMEQQLSKKSSLETELEELVQTAEEEQMGLQEAVSARNNALAEIENFAREREDIQRQRDEFRKAVEETRQNLSRILQEQQQLAIHLESACTSRLGIDENVSRYQQQAEQFRDRLEGLAEASLEEEGDTVGMLEGELERLLADRVRQEKKLNEARDLVAASENLLKELEQARQLTEQGIQEQRSVMETLKLSLSELTVRSETFEEQLAQTAFFKHDLLAKLDGASSVQVHEQELVKLEQRIKRLGPINLAAIEEYKEQSERKVYLDSQNDDLVDALETLEAAIAKIDRESRTRFKDTFEKVNASLQEMFPKLFGGGQAYLEMTDSDLLTTGISIMARPPGKRISNIYLMSGGEKALTAVAMVFAIFELNPAPFCMLDEVDAPLDEANVGRFCELVRTMSERVQFIFITHNKTTMELADQLIGVTMREPGVSRQVDVDLAAAASMATG